MYLLADFCLGEKNETVLCVVKEMGVGGDVHATGAQDVTVAFMRVVIDRLEHFRRVRRRGRKRRNNDDNDDGRDDESDDAARDE